MSNLAYDESTVDLPKNCRFIAVGDAAKHAFKTDAMASWVAALRLKAKSRGAYSQPSSTPIKRKGSLYIKIINRGSMDCSVKDGAGLARPCPQKQQHRTIGEHTVAATIKFQHKSWRKSPTG